MIIRLKEMRVIPALMALVFAMYNSLSFNAVDMNTASYLMLGLMLLTMVGSTFLIVHNQGVSRFTFYSLLLLFWIAIITMLNGNDLKNWIYYSASLATLFFLCDYYRDNISSILIGALIGFTISIYISLGQLIQNPYLWLQNEDEINVVSGFIMGGNYNQMGPRLICGVLTNILCLKYSKWFWLNLIPLLMVCIAQLVMVQSMTSLVSLLLFIILCCIPGTKFSRFCITGLLSCVILFQIFVCFNGNGIENNEFATWFIVDVLGKDITFTNRTALWDAAMRIFSNSPLLGYGHPTSEWYYSNLASTAIGPHNLIFALMIFGGIPATILFITIVVTVLVKLQKVKDRYATTIYAAISVLSLMSLMEVYSIQIIFYFIILAYYYGQSQKESLISS